MASLAKCLKTMGEKISPEDKARVQELAKQYKADGMTQQEAEIEAVSDLDGELRLSRKGIEKQITDAGGIVPTRGKKKAKLRTLKGAPSKINIAGRGEVEFGFHEPAVDAAKKYAEESGIDYVELTDYMPPSPERGKRLSDAWEQVEHKPDDPKVKAAYKAMVDETKAQFQVIVDTGIDLEWMAPDQKDPYATVREVILDAVENNHMWMYPAESGFGSDDSFDTSNHPLLADTGIVIKGHKILVNDMFRVVHDYFGHVKHGVGFRAGGEENAWQSHAVMYSPEARLAMTGETRGQNSWLNYGPHSAQNKTAKTEDTIFADQKVGLLPEWAMQEDAIGAVENENEATRKVDAKRFLEALTVARESHKFGHRVGLPSVKDLGKSNLFLSFDGKSGFALSSDGMISTGFSIAGGRMKGMGEKAIRLGGNMVEVFDTGLVEKYEQFGFEEVSREKWDESKKFPDWKPEDGKPDFVTMKLRKDGSAFSDFFKGVVEGESGKPVAGAEYTPRIGVLKDQLKDPKSEYGKYHVTYQSRKGSFDDHIALSIPTYRDAQYAVGVALINTFDSATMMDIAAAEGTQAKTISDLSGGKIKTLSLDPSSAFRTSFNQSPVDGATFTMTAFGYGENDTGVAWTEANGTEIKYYDAGDKKFDIIQESMTFQFINDERGAQIARMAELLTETGMVVINEKLQNADWDKNEKQKNEYKSKSFKAEDMTKKARQVLEGMNKNMVHHSELEQILKDNFKYVVQYWDSGNFKGYVASNSQETISKFQNNLPDMNNEFDTRGPDVNFSLTKNDIGLYSGVEKTILELKLPQWKKKKGDPLTTEERELYTDVNENPLKDTEGEFFDTKDSRYEGYQKVLAKLRKHKGTAKGQAVWEKIKSSPVKKEEVEWLGLEDYLKTEPDFTREEVANFVSENGVNVVEISTQGFDSKGGLDFDWQKYMDVNPDNWMDEVGEYSFEWDTSDSAKDGKWPFWHDDNELEWLDLKADLEMFSERSGVAKLMAEAEAMPEKTDEERSAKEKKELSILSISQVRTEMKSAFMDAAADHEKHIYFGDPMITYKSKNYPVLIRGNKFSGFSYLVINDSKPKWLSQKLSSLHEAEVQVTSEARVLGVIPSRMRNGPQWEEYVMDGDQENYRELKLTLPDVGANFVNDVHFEEPNIVAWLRVNDRELPAATEDLRTTVREHLGQFIVQAYDGRDDAVFNTEEEANTFIDEKLKGVRVPAPEVKTYFLDEFQSDWHQEGRQRGYKSNPDMDAIEKREEEIYDEQVSIVDDAFDKFYAKLKVVTEKEASDMAHSEEKVEKVNGEYPLFASELTVRGEKRKTIISYFEHSRHGQSVMTIERQGMVPKANKAARKNFEIEPSGLEERGENKERIAQRVMMESGVDLEHYKELVAEIDKGIAIYEQERKGVDNAPFKNDGWINLGMKRALIDAVESGYDAIAFPNGQVLAERWSESFRTLYETQYDKKMPSIMKKLTGVKPKQFDLNGDPIVSGPKVVDTTGWTAKADRDDPTWHTVWNADNLTVQGLHADSKSQAIERAADNLAKVQSGPSTGYYIFEITPELREKIQKEGLPLFREAGAADNSRTGTGKKGIGKVAVDEAIAKQIDSVRADTGLRVRVISTAEIPASVARKIPKGSVPKGFAVGDTVFLIHDVLTSASDAQLTFAHEVKGHFGVENIIDEWSEVEAMYGKLKGLGGKTFNSILDEVHERNGENISSLSEVKEFIAIAAERRHEQGSIGKFMQKIREMFAAAMNSMGFNLKTMGDIDLILSRSENFLKSSATPIAGTSPAFSLADANKLRTGKETLKKYGVDPLKRHTKRVVAAALEARQRAVAGVIDRKDYSVDAEKKIARWIVEEIKFEMQPENRDESGVGWYSEKFQTALDNLSEIFPEMKTDSSVRELFTAVIAITSDQQRVSSNLDISVRAYEFYKENGRLPVKGDGFTVQSSSVLDNFKTMNDLVEEFGLDGARDFLMSEETVSELKKSAAEIDVPFNTAYKANMKLPMASLVFGPKLGVFYSNLMGSHGYLTMDRWWMRTFNRYRGQLLQRVGGTEASPTDSTGKKIGLARYKEIIKQESISDDEALVLITEDAKAYEKKGYKNGTPREKAANTLYKKAFVELEDSPFSASDREFMINTVNRAKKNLSRTGNDMTVADIQATLWYYEKRLYGGLGVRQSADISYEEAATEIVRNKTGSTPRRATQNAKGKKTGTSKGDVQEVNFSLAKDENGDAFMSLTDGAIKTAIRVSNQWDMDVGEHTNSFIVRMPIDDFLKLTTSKDITPDMLLKEGPKTSNIKPYDETTPERFNPSEVDQDGEYAIPFLYVHKNLFGGTATVTGHEGRHRSVILKQDGGTTIPVRIKVTNADEVIYEQGKDSADITDTGPLIGQFEKGRSADLPNTRVLLTPDSFASVKGLVGTNSEPSIPQMGVDEDVNFSLTSSTTPAFDVKAEELSDRALRYWQDKFRPMKKTQEAITEAGGSISDSSDVYQAEELFYGKTEEDLRVIEETFVKPLVEVMGDKDITQDQLDEWLYANHAKERNAQIAKINPEMPDGGSGMTDAEADRILAMNTEQRAADLDEAAEFVYALLDHKRELMRAGLQADEITDKWEKVYKNYVPLKGLATDEGGSIAGTGRGYDIRGKEGKRAMGRKSRAESPLNHAIRDVTESVIRSRKNEVGNSFLKLVEDNPNDAYWEIFTDEKPDTDRRIIKKAGGDEVTEVPVNMAAMKDKYFATKKDGKAYYIKINDERLIRALQNMGPEPMGVVTQKLGMVTRFLSSVNTSWNPEFTVSNLIRDVQTAVINTLAEQEIPTGKIKGKSIAKQMVKDIPVAMRAIHATLRGKELTGTAREWQMTFERFRTIGGKTGWFDMKDVDQQAASLERMLSVQRGGKIATAQAFASGTLEMLDNANTAVENAVRLSVYHHAINSGVSEKKAASLAKNLTVNFNRKGEIGAVMNTMYMFFNASVQGTAVFARAIGTMRKDDGARDLPVIGNRRLTSAQKFAGGMVAASFALSVLNRLMAGDDDDGENWFDKLPNHVRERNVVIMKSIFGGEAGEYYSFPLPYGYNIFHVIGDTFESAVNSDARKAPELATHLVASTVGAFMPIGIEGSDDLWKSIAKTIIPTVGKPIVSLAVNENFFGGKIYKENYSGTPKPASQLVRKSTKEHWKLVSEFLNDFSGGSAFRSGYIDVNPDQLGYLFDFATGGAGAFVDRTTDYVAKTVKGEEVEAREVPFKRKVVGSIEDFYDDTGSFYDRHDSIMQIVDEYKSLKGKEKLEFKAQFPEEFKMFGKAKSTKKYLATMRKLGRKVDEGDKTDEQKEALLDIYRDKMDVRVDKFNKEFNEKVE